MEGQNLTDCPMDSSFGQFSLWQAGQTSQKKAGDDDEMRGDGGEVKLVKLWQTNDRSPTEFTIIIDRRLFGSQVRESSRKVAHCPLVIREMKETPVSFEGWASEAFEVFLSVFLVWFLKRRLHGNADPRWSVQSNLQDVQGTMKALVWMQHLKRSEFVDCFFFFFGTFRILAFGGLSVILLVLKRTFFLLRIFLVFFFLCFWRLTFVSLWARLGHSRSRV